MARGHLTDISTAGPIDDVGPGDETSSATVLGEHVPEHDRILLDQRGFTDERALLLGILEDIGEYLHIRLLGLQRKVGDLTLLPVLDATDVEVCDVTTEGEELVYKLPHILLRLETSATTGMYMCDVEDGTDPIDLVHDLAYLIEGAELSQLAHGLHAEDDILDPLVIQHVLALGQTGNDGWECRLGRFTVGCGMDHDDVRTEVVCGTGGVHDPTDALLTGLIGIRVETDEIGGVTTEPDVKLLGLGTDLPCPLRFYACPAYELNLQGIQTETFRVFQ